MKLSILCFHLNKLNSQPGNQLSFSLSEKEIPEEQESDSSAEQNTNNPSSSEENPISFSSFPILFSSLLELRTEVKYLINLELRKGNQGKLGGMKQKGTFWGFVKLPRERKESSIIISCEQVSVRVSSRCNDTCQVTREGGPDGVQCPVIYYLDK